MRRWLFFILATILQFSSQHPSYISTHAQTALAEFIPTPVYLASSVFIPGQKFFIQGGIADIYNNARPTISQTFYIDLSQKWPTSKPVYGKLPDIPETAGYITALGNNNSNWYFFYQSVQYKFNIPLSTWEKLSPIKSGEFVFKPESPAVNDPTINQIFIMNGEPQSFDSVPVSTVRFDPVIGQLSSGSTLVPVYGSFTATWNTLKNHIFIFGGLSLGIAQNTLYNYIPSSTNPYLISIAQVSGDNPSARSGHCMVEAYNGTKMILFGGYDQSARTLDDIYILDVSSMKWKKGTPVGSTARRRGASCAVTNDYFVVWSGVELW
jgi:hypothetical protein